MQDQTSPRPYVFINITVQSQTAMSVREYISVFLTPTEKQTPEATPHRLRSLFVVSREQTPARLSSA